MFLYGPSVSRVAPCITGRWDSKLAALAVRAPSQFCGTAGPDTARGTSCCRAASHQHHLHMLHPHAVALTPLPTSLLPAMCSITGSTYGVTWCGIMNFGGTKRCPRSV